MTELEIFLIQYPLIVEKNLDQVLTLLGVS
jgi:hypothetical protein